MMRNGMRLMILLFWLFPFQEDPEREWSILVWNVENFFDPVFRDGGDDPEFTPESVRRWTWKRFREKRNRIARTIVAAAGDSGRLPDAVALCETENAAVLRSLAEETVLVKAGYAFVHYEGQDRRGIEPALLYRPERMDLIGSRPVPVRVAEGIRKPRDLLYAVFRFRPDGSRHHLIVCHWPSKWGGARRSEAGRNAAADCLLELADSIRKADPDGLILAVGDFNAGPESPVLERLSPVLRRIPLQYAEGTGGTVRYRGRWETIDHIFTTPENVRRHRIRAGTFAPDFLLEPDPVYLGMRPRRTYIGPRYHDGTSDHLPVLAGGSGYISR